MFWTIPNVLTCFRLVATLLIGVAFVFLSRPIADFLALILFISAALTDWFDGHLARRWRQVTPLGAMLDPIADKAIVVITSLCLVAYTTLPPLLILLPLIAIVFREIFVSGLREYLGQSLSGLQVTVLAKYKTTFQLIALGVLLGHGLFEQNFARLAYGASQEMIEQILYADADDPLQLRVWFLMTHWLSWIGISMLWIAALLTLVTGFDYFFKALPRLKERS